MKPGHLQKHFVIYLLCAIALGNAFVAQFKDLTAAQEAAMTGMNWAVAFVQFLVAGAVVIVGYLKRPADDTDDAPEAIPATPAPAPGLNSMVTSTLVPASPVPSDPPSALPAQPPSS